MTTKAEATELMLLEARAELMKGTATPGQVAGWAVRRYPSTGLDDNDVRVHLELYREVWGIYSLLVPGGTLEDLEPHVDPILAAREEAIYQAQAAGQRAHTVSLQAIVAAEIA